jgi:hypothetical protein
MVARGSIPARSRRNSCSKAARRAACRRSASLSTAAKSSPLKRRRHASRLQIGAEIDARTPCNSSRSESWHFAGSDTDAILWFSRCGNWSNASRNAAMRRLRMALIASKETSLPCNSSTFESVSPAKSLRSIPRVAAVARCLAGSSRQGTRQLRTAERHFRLPDPLAQ